MGWFTRRQKQREQQLDQEIRFHIERSVADAVRQGVPEEEARRRAKIEFGSVDQTKEECREVHLWTWFEQLWQDLHYAARMVRRSPGFTAVAVVSLALGIGANTAIFSLVNAVLVRQLPVPEPERLVLFSMKTQDGFGGNTISYPLFQQIRDRNTVLSGFAGISSPPMTLSDGNVSERVQGELVTGTYFETLGVNAILGRVLTRDDDRIPDGHPVCVISYGLWQRRFGGDPGVVGRTVQLSGRAFTVLGVTPKEFLGTALGAAVDVRVPTMMMGSFTSFRAGLNNRGLQWLQPIARLKPGVSVAQAQAALEALYHQIPEEQEPGSDQTKVILKAGGQGLGSFRETYERPLLLLMSVVGLVLLIACANVANLLMTRASVRRKEIAVRLALGAGRARLVRQLLAESFVLAGSGAALGMALAFWIDRALLGLAPRRGGAQIVLDVNPDWRVLLFTLAISILVGVLFGMAPAIQATKPMLAPALKGESSLRAPGRFSFSKILVVTQIGLSLVLLIGAGLFLQSLRNLKSVDPGFDPERLVILSVNPSLSGYRPAASWNFFDTLVQRVQSLPGVLSASLARVTPLGGGGMLSSISVPGYQPKAGENLRVWLNLVGADYFKTLGTPLLAGRAFDDQDGRGTRKVLIVNETLASRFWPKQNPIGKRVLAEPDDFEVIGVVKNSKYQSLKDEPFAVMFQPLRPSPPRELTLHVRVAGEATPAIAALVAEIRGLDRNLPVYNVATMDAQLNNSIALDRLLATLTSLFGFLAVTLAAVGLYGVMAFAVAARTREIGIRMALGANRTRVLRQVIGESTLLTLIGVALGIPAALWASRGVESLLYGLPPNHAITYWLYAAVLVAVALAAAWIPARRAARVDPLIALRYE